MARLRTLEKAREKTRITATLRAKHQEAKVK